MQASVIRSRASPWKSVSRLGAARRREGEARIRFASPAALKASWPQQRGPDTSRVATRSHTVVSVCGPRSKAAKSLGVACYAACVRTNDRVPAIVEIVAYERVHVSLKIRSGQLPPVTSADYELNKGQRCYLRRWMIYTRLCLL